MAVKGLETRSSSGLAIGGWGCMRRAWTAGAGAKGQSYYSIRTSGMPKVGEAGRCRERMKRWQKESDRRVIMYDGRCSCKRTLFE